MYGKHHSDESKRKMSKTRLENPQEYNEERRTKISKLRIETYKKHPEIKNKISGSLKKKYEEDFSFKEKILILIMLISIYFNKYILFRQIEIKFHLSIS